MQRKMAVILIFLFLNCYVNVFAEIYQRNDIGALVYTDSEYAIATDAQAMKVENITKKDNKEAEIRIEDEIVNISFPANIHAYFDPGNLSGKGQVFSDSYTIKNYGNKDLSIKIKNIDINYWSDEYTYEFTEEKVTATASQIKRINVDMIWKNKSEKEKKILKILDSEPNQIVLNLKAAKYDEDGEFIELNDNSIGSFYFTGTLNSNPNLVWENGEITLNFDYEIVSDGSIETTSNNEKQEIEKGNNRDKRISDNNIAEKKGDFSHDSIQKTEDLEIDQDENKNDDKKESNVKTGNETIENETEEENKEEEEIKEKEQETKQRDEETTEDEEIIEDKEITNQQETSEEEQNTEKMEELKKEQIKEQVDEISNKETDKEKVIEGNEEGKGTEKDNKENMESGGEEKEEMSIESTSKLKDEIEPVIIRNTTEGLEDSIEAE